jgi:hypothetical protein
MSDQLLIPCRPEDCPSHQAVLDALRRSFEATSHQAGVTADLKTDIAALHTDVRSVKALLLVNQDTGKAGVLPRLERLEMQFDDHVSEATKRRDFRLSATLQLVLLILAPVVSTIIGALVLLVAYTHWLAPAVDKAAP